MRSRKFCREILLGNGKTYRVDYTIYSLGGLGTGWAIIYQNSRQVAHLTWSNSNTKEGYEAIANYCAKLNQLHIDVWKDFMAECASGITKGALKKKNVRTALDRAEKVINALCDQKALEELLAELGNEALTSLLSEDFHLWWFSSKNKFAEYVKKNDSTGVGKGILEAARKFQLASQKLKTFKDAVNKYATEVQTPDITSQLYNLYQEFKTVYTKNFQDDAILKGVFKELK